MGARGSLGKSRLLLQWALAVASGQAVFDKISVDAAHVLFFALEDTEQSLAERLRILKPYYETMPDRLHLYHMESGPNGTPPLRRIDEGGLLQVVRNLVPVPASLNTFQLGTARPLCEIPARLSARFERELSILETDMAVRAGSLRLAGSERPLPAGWDRPFYENGEAISARLVEEWGSGSSLDVILIVSVQAPPAGSSFGAG
ncbi:MAG: AAA family ATPase [Oscillochloridaceae bacterium umkhey_bin13]